MLIKLAAIAAFFIVVLSVRQLTRIIKNEREQHQKLKTKNELLMAELVANETALLNQMEYEA